MSAPTKVVPSEVDYYTSFSSRFGSHLTSLAPSLLTGVALLHEDVATDQMLYYM